MIQMQKKIKHELQIMSACFIKLLGEFYINYSFNQSRISYLQGIPIWAEAGMEWYGVPYIEILQNLRG